jgi:cell division septation protein DedD
MVTLRLHRSAVILMIVLSVVFAILIFVLGWVFASARAPKVALTKPQIAAPKVPQLKAPTPAVTSTVPRGVIVADKPPQQMLAVRVGMFTAEEDAKALVQRLAAAKIAASILPMPTDDGPTLYLVLVGRYTNRRDAASAATWLSREQGVDTAVMPVKQ